MKARVLTFDTEHGAFECTNIHFLGSADPGSRTWLWSWANQSGFPETVAELAASIRDLGLAHDIHELSNAQLPFDAFGIDRTEPHLVVFAQTDVVKFLTGYWTSYTPLTSGGTRLAFLLEGAEFQLPPPDGPRIVRVLSEGLMGLSLQDHRRAISSYLSLRGLNFRFWPDSGRNSGTLTIDSPNLSGDIIFDEQGRTSSLRIRLSSNQSGY